MGKITKCFHDKVVYSRRMNRLTELLIPLLGESHNVLDVGCGDGKIDSLITSQQKVEIMGIDVLVRPQTYIEVREYDGKHIPFEDKSFDTVMAIDVLHHTDNPTEVLKEMARVSGKFVILKDHVRTGLISYIKLRAMDYVGNAHYKVRLPYNYQTEKQWKDMFDECQLDVVACHKKLNLYTGLWHLLFDRNLHVIYLIQKNN